MSSSPLVPRYFRAGPAHARGYPRIESSRRRGLIDPPRDGSPQQFAAALETNLRLLRSDGIFDITLEKKGSKWPDFIGHQAWSGTLLASEKVCETLAREGVTGFELFPTEFVQPLPGKLGQTPPPRYFAIKPVIEIRYRVDVLFLEDGCFNPRGSYLLPDEKAKAPKDEEGICNIHEPDGLDGLENVIFGKVPEGFGCDARVAELAFREGWTNLQLRAFDAPYLPRMSTPTAPRVACATGRMADAWYTPLQEQALRQRAATRPTGGFWKRWFGRR